MPEGPGLLLGIGINHVRPREIQTDIVFKFFHLHLDSRLQSGVGLPFFFVFSLVLFSLVGSLFSFLLFCSFLFSLFLGCGLFLFFLYMPYPAEYGAKETVISETLSRRRCLVRD